MYISYMKKFLIIFAAAAIHIHTQTIPACKKMASTQKLDAQCEQCYQGYTLQNNRCVLCAYPKIVVNNACAHQQSSETQKVQLSSTTTQNQNPQPQSPSRILQTSPTTDNTTSSYPQTTICLQYINDQCSKCRPGYTISNDENNKKICTINDTKIYCRVYSKTVSKCLLCKDGYEINDDLVCWESGVAAESKQKVIASKTQIITGNTTQKKQVITNQGNTTSTISPNTTVNTQSSSSFNNNFNVNQENQGSAFNLQFGLDDSFVISTPVKEQTQVQQPKQTQKQQIPQQSQNLSNEATSVPTEDNTQNFFSNIDSFDLDFSSNGDTSQIQAHGESTNVPSNSQNSNTMNTIINQNPNFDSDFQSGFSVVSEKVEPTTTTIFQQNPINPFDSPQNNNTNNTIPNNNKTITNSSTTNSTNTATTIANSTTNTTNNNTITKTVITNPNKIQTPANTTSQFFAQQSNFTTLITETPAKNESKSTIPTNTTQTINRIGVFEEKNGSLSNSSSNKIQVIAPQTIKPSNTTQVTPVASAATSSSTNTNANANANVNVNATTVSINATSSENNSNFGVVSVNEQSGFNQNGFTAVSFDTFNSQSFTTTPTTSQSSSQNSTKTDTPTNQSTPPPTNSTKNIAVVQSKITASSNTTTISTNGTITPTNTTIPKNTTLTPTPNTQNNQTIEQPKPQYIHLYPQFPYCTDFFQGQCYACDPAYVLNLIINKCIKLQKDPTEFSSKLLELSVDQFCNAKDENGLCVECYRNYYFNKQKKRCLEVDALCRTYNADTGQCTSCYTNHKLSSGKCIAE